MENINVVFIIAAIWIVFQIWQIETRKKQIMQEIEIQFLLASMEFIKFKHQTLSVLKMAYDKAGESDPQFIADFQKINESVEKKFEQIGDDWVFSLQSKIGYKTVYKNWSGATKYIEDIVRQMKQNESRKGN